MRIRVRLFASAAEAAGSDLVTVEVGAETRSGAGPSENETATVGGVRSAMRTQFPELETILRRAWFALEEEYVADDRVVGPEDELAVIPPVSGGEGLCASAGGDIVITQEPLSPAEVYGRITTPEMGAVVLFGGTVREFTGGRRTLRLEYEAYPEMACKKMQEIKWECEKKWPGSRVVIWHRVGRLELTETSVLVGASSPHRADAFAAARHAIDTLKKTVPIWKKEFYADGGTEWVDPTARG